MKIVIYASLLILSFFALKHSPLSIIDPYLGALASAPLIILMAEAIRIKDNRRAYLCCLLLTLIFLGPFGLLAAVVFGAWLTQRNRPIGQAMFDGVFKSLIREDTTVEEEKERAERDQYITDRIMSKTKAIYYLKKMEEPSVDKRLFPNDETDDDIDLTEELFDETDTSPPQR